MTDPREFLGLATTGAASGDTSVARRLLRRWHGMTDTRIVPQVEPWPYTTDANGQSYPSGLVGVRFTYTSQRGNDLVTFNDTSLVAVPDTLSADYLHRWESDHNIAPLATNPHRVGQSSPQPSLSSGSVHSNVYGWAGSSSPFPVNLSEGNTFTEYTWMPENRGNSCITEVVMNRKIVWAAAPTAGMRYFRYATIQTNGVFLRQWVRLRISRFADGHQGSAGTFGTFGSGGEIGDTIVYELVGFRDYPGPWSTYWLDSGWQAALESPLGERCFYCYSIELVNQVPAGGLPTEADWLFDETFGGGQTLWFGPRVDLPLPWTFTGLDASGDHLIAPGGVVPGVVPGYP